MEEDFTTNYSYSPDDHLRSCFDVLLTVHLGIILVTDQLDAKILVL